ncbi:ABC transporter ATP-binding protein [Alkalibacterium olivapovliticus]|uniref:ABC-2 type transport system ATP-binding protein n=1 Tax=Alkalibacterium olivapovliticus TaxID=99907 RepID=A0A2T0W3X5_9LACT|nr:ABC transporter ATP-binding protein [Alkalibacterium olivapovliticus]PRY80091.1 ABC-2 type transport system ATP-binding protein [Alkalibacterium olivapovliticus]
MLEIKGVSQSFGDHTVLDDINLTIRGGEIVGLVAPNGTGKTTLLNIVMNFLKPDEGKITYKQKMDYSSKRKEIQMRRHLSFLPEIDDLYQELTGLEHINYYGRLWQQTTREVEQIIERLHMTHYVKNPVKTYSLGMRQRLCFAMMLAADTEVMLMDEVMNGLDPDNVDLLTAELINLKERGKIIMIASHLLNNLDLYSDRVLFLKDGRVVLESVHESQECDSYIKVTVPSHAIEQLKTEKPFPEGSRYMSHRLLCIPLNGMQPDQVGDWVSFLYKKGYRDTTIGEIGSSEWYSELYNNK